MSYPNFLFLKFLSLSLIKIDGSDNYVGHIRGKRGGGIRDTVEMEDEEDDAEWFFWRKRVTEGVTVTLGKKYDVAKLESLGLRVGS